jgi:hypothetical protein
MGQDFMTKVDKSIKRRLDRALVDLSTPQLFTPTAECAAPVVAAELDAGVSTKPGDTFLAAIDDGKATLYRDNVPVGQLTGPTVGQLGALEQSPAVATVCDVLPYTDGRGIEVRLS